MFKKVYGVLFLALALAGCSGGESNVIKIGCASPLTGDQAQIGMDSCNGVKLAVEHANAKGLGIAGQTFEVLALDDQHNPAQAVNVAKKFVAEPNVLAVMGHFNSSCSKPAGAIYNEANLVQLTAGSTNPDLSKQGYKTFFRVSATDDVQGPSGARYAFQKMGAKSVFIIDDKTTYGKGLADEFEKEAKKLGMTVLGHEGITQGDKDFTPLLTRIKPMNADLIYFGGIYPEGALLIRQARSLNLTAKFMGGDGTADPLFSKLASPEIANGTQVTMVGGDIYKVPEAQEFIKAYEARFGTVGLWSAYAYDATNILIQAIAKAGTKDRVSVLNAMRQIPEFSGVTGKIAFDEKGDNKNQFIGMFQFRDGKLEYLGPAS